MMRDIDEDFDDYRSISEREQGEADYRASELRKASRMETPTVKKNRVYFHHRTPHGDVPGGTTVSKTKTLPHGDFGITEYTWGGVSLWFIDRHQFTADERQAAYEEWI